MNNKPLISVIVPCYNDGKYIHDCLNSVHNQSYENYEIIVIDDGSNEISTNEIISQINHSKITVLQTKNQGPSNARNQAIRSSKGKYILPLDADNKVGRSFVSDAVDYLEKNSETKIVNCDLVFFGVKKGVKIFPNFTIEKLICENIIECASIYRRSDFDQTMGYNPNMKEGLEDWDFWLSLLENGGGVYKLDLTEIYYRVKNRSRNNSISSEQFRRLRRQIYNNHKELFAKYLLDPQESFEYALIKQSKEYKLGMFLLNPIRTLYKKLFYNV